MALACRATVLLPEIVARLISTIWPSTLRNTSRSSICSPVTDCPSSRRSSKSLSSAPLAHEYSSPSERRSLAKVGGHRPPSSSAYHPERRYTYWNPTAGIHQRRQNLAAVEGQWENSKSTVGTSAPVRFPTPNEGGSPSINGHGNEGRILRTERRRR